MFLPTNRNRSTPGDTLGAESAARMNGAAAKAVPASAEL
jgi:hypothetical protein